MGEVGNGELLTRLSALVKRGNELTADLLAHLAEVMERRLHLELGYSSAFAYCVEGLGLSEPAAGRRIVAAQVCRRFPPAFSAVSRGDLHLSALCALNPYLDPTNAPELLEAARRKSRRQIEELLAARFPKRDVRQQIRRSPDRITPLGATVTPQSHVDPAAQIEPLRAARQTQQQQVADSSSDTEASTDVEASPHAAIQAVAAARYGMHLTIDTETRHG